MSKIKIELDELQEKCGPLQDLINKKGHPHIAIIVTIDTIKVVEDVVSCPKIN